IAVAHNIPYVATCCPSYPFDMIEKVSKALAADGPAYIHCLSVCPTGWRCATEDTIKIGRLAVETGVFPLYEVVNGEYKMSMETPALKPLKEYASLQRRFRHLTEESLDLIQERVQLEYNKIAERAACALKLEK
ncbi:MAG: pyruvate ferredoxin oxidoreductase, partial [Dehalococcoides mccartyi]